jgi:hypothetical protein
MARQCYNLKPDPQPVPDHCAMTRLQSLLLVLLLLTATSAGARMYQWHDPDSRSVQF